MKYIAMVVLATIMSIPYANAGKGGEGNNTGCNGKGNVNSPCTPKPKDPPAPTPPPSTVINNEQEQTNRQGQGQAQGQDQGQSQTATGGGGGSGIGIGVGGVGGTGGTGGSGGESSSVAGAVSGSSSGAASGSNSEATGGYSGGNSLASDATSGASSDSSISITGDSSSYRSTAFVAPAFQTAAPSFAEAGAMIAERGVCGPRVVKRSERVSGVIGKLKVDLGSDDTLEPADVPFTTFTAPTGLTYLLGHSVIIFAGQNTVAASKGFGIGGNNSGLAGGQLGASTNSAATRTTLRIVVTDCMIPMQEATPSVPLPPRTPRG